VKKIKSCIDQENPEKLKVRPFVWQQYTRGHCFELSLYASTYTVWM